MRAGSRRCFITIETPTKTKQANSSTLVTWSTFTQLWASIETLKAYEKAAVNAEWPGAESKISFRYIEGVLPTMRIKFGDKIYSILGINNVNMRNRDLILTCKTGVSSQ
jgi:SPP1 family predicted phage head-tail adaptor